MQRQEPPSPASPRSEKSPDLCRYPTSLWIFGLIGMLTFVTACLGIVSPHCASCGMDWVHRCHYIILLLLLFCQAAALCYFFRDDEGRANTKYARMSPSRSPPSCMHPALLRHTCIFTPLQSFFSTSRHAHLSAPGSLSWSDSDRYRWHTCQS